MDFRFSSFFLCARQTPPTEITSPPPAQWWRKRRMPTSLCTLAGLVKTQHRMRMNVMVACWSHAWWMPVAQWHWSSGWSTTDPSTDWPLNHQTESGTQCVLSRADHMRIQDCKRMVFMWLASSQMGRTARSESFTMLHTAFLLLRTQLFPEWTKPKTCSEIMARLLLSMWVAQWKCLSFVHSLMQGLTCPDSNLTCLCGRCLTKMAKDMLAFSRHCAPSLFSGSLTSTLTRFVSNRRNTACMFSVWFCAETKVVINWQWQKLPSQTLTPLDSHVVDLKGLRQESMHEDEMHQTNALELTLCIEWIFGPLRQLFVTWDPTKGDEKDSLKKMWNKRFWIGLPQSGEWTWMLPIWPTVCWEQRSFEEIPDSLERQGAEVT